MKHSPALVALYAKKFLMAPVGIIGAVYKEIWQNGQKKRTTAKVTIACQGASMGHFTAYRQIQSGRLPLADLAQIWVCFSGFPES